MEPDEGTPPQEPEAEAAPAPEAPAPEQAPEVAPPDPFASLTFDQVRERFGTDIEAEKERVKRQAFSDAQGALRKEFATWTKQFQGEEQAKAVYARLEKLRTSQDYSEQQTFSEEIATPQMLDAYKRGREVAQRESIDPNLVSRLSWEAKVEAYEDFLGSVAQEPEFKGVTQARWDELRASEEAKQGPHKFALLVIKEGVKATLEKEREGIRAEEHDAARKEVYAELRGKGIGVEELDSGSKPAPRGDKAQIEQDYIDGKIDSEGYRQRLEALGVRP